MGPVDVIDVFEYIGNMKRDNTHCIVESLLVEICIHSGLRFSVFVKITSASDGSSFFMRLLNSKMSHVDFKAFLFLGTVRS